MLRVMLKGYIKGSSGASTWTPGHGGGPFGKPMGEGSGELVWNYYTQAYQKRSHYEEFNELVSGYFRELKAHREEKHARRAERVRRRVEREEMLRVEREGWMKAWREQKRDELNMGEEDAESGESELDEGEVGEIEEELEEMWPEAENDTDG